MTDAKSHAFGWSCAALKPIIFDVGAERVIDAVLDGTNGTSSKL
jgi:hypothetical protein